MYPCTHAALLLQNLHFIIDLLSGVSQQFMLFLSLYLTNKTDYNELSFHSCRIKMKALKETYKASFAAGSLSTLILQGL